MRFAIPPYGLSGLCERPTCAHNICNSAFPFKAREAAGPKIPLDW